MTSLSEQALSIYDKLTCAFCGAVGVKLDMWPDGKDGYLCQDCWERACAEAWWSMLSDWQEEAPSVG